jgi:ABC-2 type transport system permease protein
VIGLIRSELRKLFTTQVWFWMLIGSLALAALSVVGTILTDGSDGNPAPRLTTVEGQRNLFGSGAAGTIFICVLGIIGITSEYRHLTATPTFLITPVRAKVIAAKLISYAVLGVGYALCNIVLVIAMVLPWLSAKDIDVSITGNGIPMVFLATLVATAIYGILGIGIGALIRNQIAAVSITLVYLFVIESLLSVIPGVKEGYRFFPGAAGQAVVQAVNTNATLLEPWQGGLLLAGYGVLFAALATRLTVRRDVT